MARRRRSSICLLFGLVAALVPLAVIGAVPASANAVGCGSVVVQSVVLQGDIGPCPGDGLFIATDGVVVDLNGHRIIGTPGQPDTIGIFVRSAWNVTIRGGTVSHFATGIRLQQDLRTRVTEMRILHNVGRGGVEFGGSLASRLERSTVAYNGPLYGIDLFGISNTSVTIDSNAISYNQAVFPGDGVDPPKQITIGISLHSGIDTRITNNRIVGNGWHGITTGPAAIRSTIVANTVSGNGFHSEANETGGGIQLGPSNLLLDRRDPSRDNVVARNVVTGNAASGIVVTAPQSTISHNVVLGNATATHPGNLPAFDLHDRLPGCDATTWQANTYQTGSPDCVA